MERTSGGVIFRGEVAQGYLDSFDLITQHLGEEVVGQVMPHVGRYVQGRMSRTTLVDMFHYYFLVPAGDSQENREIATEVVNSYLVGYLTQTEKWSKPSPDGQH